MTSLYQYYQVKKVFIACPGDLMEERSRIPDIIDEINFLSAHKKGIHLELVGWENVIPDMGRPQSLINQELQQSDLVLIMFFKRIGSPSRSSEKDRPKSKEEEIIIKHLPNNWLYPVTGTLEEFCIASELYMANKKPLLGIYFKNVTQADRAEVSKRADDQAQLIQVDLFRKYLESGNNYLFRLFDDQASFDKLIRRHLNSFIEGQSRVDIEKHLKYLIQCFMGLQSKRTIVYGDVVDLVRYDCPVDAWVYFYDKLHDIQEDKATSTNPSYILKLSHDINNDGIDEEIIFLNVHDHGASFTYLDVKMGTRTYRNLIDVEFHKLITPHDREPEPCDYESRKFEAFNLFIAKTRNIDEWEIGIAHSEEDAFNTQLFLYSISEATSGNKNHSALMPILHITTHMNRFISRNQQIIVPRSPSGIYEVYKWNGKEYDLNEIYRDELYAQGILCPYYQNDRVQ